MSIISENKDKARSPKKKFAILFGVVAVVVAVLLLMAWSSQRSLIYYPNRDNPGPAADRFTSGTDVQLETEDGLTLSAWQVNPAEPSGQAVLYLPGNGGSRLNRVDVAQEIADQGFTVLLLDYRGYGGNSGNPSEKGLVLDAKAALAYLHAEGFASDQIFYVAESLGNGVAVQLAVDDSPAGLLLRSPYTSLDAVGQNMLGIPVGWLMQDHFDTLSLMDEVQCPVTVLAGLADALIPASQSVAVAKAAPDLQELVTVPDAGHNDDIWFGPFLVDHLVTLAEASQK